jgi:hypothetical protein
MALKQNQLLIATVHAKTAAIIERLYKVVNDMFRSFDLENNHENLEEEQEE